MIPKLFHFIWIGPHPLPVESVGFIEGWKRMHPLWLFKIWTDSDVPKLRNQSEYDRAASWAGKTDILKYEILEREGGVTVDVDFECLKCIDPLLTGVRAFSAYEAPGRAAIGIMGSVPHHPLFVELVAALPDSARQPVNLPEKTGPAFFSKHAIGRSDCTIFPSHLFYPYSWQEMHRRHELFPEALAVHHWHGSWQKPEGQIK